MGTRAFTQLAADNQHAPQGVLLLGVLSDIHVAVELILGKRDEALRASPNVKEATAGSPDPKAAAEDAEDLGVAVSREKIAPADEIGGIITEGTADRKSTTESGPDLDPDGARAAEKRKKKRKKRGDEFDDLFSSLI